VEVDCKFGRVEISIKANFLTIIDRVMGRCIGSMAHSIKECGMKGANVD
jgi:hypothetical protein